MLTKFEKSICLGTSILALTLSGMVGASADSYNTVHHARPAVMNDNAKSVGGYTKTDGGIQFIKHPLVAKNIQQLREALNKAKHDHGAYIITKGNFNGNVSQHGKHSMTEKDYAKGTGYNFNEYLKAYNPNFDRSKPQGVQENARRHAANKQKKNVELKVPSNTTILGASGNRMRNINLVVKGQNVILRNLNIQAPIDDFPGWDPQDGKNGNWNSAYDAISVKGGKNVWLDHNTLSDGKNVDHLPTAKTFYRQYQQHDGLADITDKADKVTVSNNQFDNHDKVMLIGSSDKRTSDKGKLHVIIKHNTFDNTVQRTPRVRFGHVSIEDNFYKNDNKQPYRFSYAWGYGKDAHIKANDNYFTGKAAKQIPKHLMAGKQGHDLNAKNVFANHRDYSVSAKGTSVKQFNKKNDSKIPSSFKSNGALSISKGKAKKIMHNYLKNHHKINSAMKWLAQALNID